MKRTIMTALIASAISHTTLANEWAKVSFAGNRADKAPAQKMVIREKTPAQTARQHSDNQNDIVDMIFAQTDMNQLAYLDKDEMRLTRGGRHEPGSGGAGLNIPLPPPNFSWSAFAKETGKSAAFSAAANQAIHQVRYNRPASLESTLYSAAGGALGAIHGGALAAGAGLVGSSKIFMQTHGMGTGFAINQANPFNRDVTPRQPAITESKTTNYYWPSYNPNDRNTPIQQHWPTHASFYDSMAPNRTRWHSDRNTYGIGGDK